MKSARLLFVFALFLFLGAAYSGWRYGYDDELTVFLGVVILIVLGVGTYYRWKDDY